MAKAIYGNLGGDPDRRLIDEVTALRARARSLDHEISRLRAENDRLAAAQADELLRLPEPAPEYSRSEEGRGGVAVATGGRYRPRSAGGVSDDPPPKPSAEHEPSAERIERLEDSLLHLGSAVDNLTKNQERRLAEIATDRIEGLERAITRLASRVEDLGQNMVPGEPPDAADNQVLAEVLELLAQHQADTRRPRLHRVMALIGAGSLFDLGGRATSEALLDTYYEAMGHERVEQ
jgi:hypothetical protein